MLNSKERNLTKNQAKSFIQNQKFLMTGKKTLSMNNSGEKWKKIEKNGIKSNYGEKESYLYRHF
ncbi:hypothetical protein A7K93_10290 [Candidatus Methylacidiphilum fumarolicum]|nr:hypothetical protein A7K73_09865 [Candidatus Methylacidiphilum fumarolicum]TFE71708.1 hypothetical protein A7K93_10290 [Candidatus Methylacidiphilum fumarolicum]TFE73637.1 hypothetical protein A7K72_05965 [Candidatus Methylacidiphilum fumarolicum]TFE77639.1 hypothetical protein A7D33_03900 [Candidatus Methylacidiphilum fumarolicum]